jgi:glutamate carboxypeptidase
LRALVALESPTRDKPAADVLAGHLQERLRGEGWQVARQAQREVGDHLIARMDAPGHAATLILAHYDTVWPVGTLREMPFRLEEDSAYGPGILDMKAGINSALQAVALAKGLGRELRGPVTLLVTSDEEQGSRTSRGLIEGLSLEHQRVLVVEPARDDGALKVGRKGVGGFEVAFSGRSAHAGNSPESGASALRELAHFLFYAEDLSSLERGTSVNLTVAQGGSVSNVIAEVAAASLDFRALTAGEAERVVEALGRYEPRDGRVQVRVTGGLNRPPLELTPANKALFDDAVACGAAMDLNVTGAVVGGGSDGNFSSALGVATLDGMGAVGEGPHARHEHIRISQTLDRLALLTAMLSQHGSKPML